MPRSRALAQISKDFNDYRVHVAEQYVGKESLDTFRREVSKRFDKGERLIINGGRNDE